MNTAALLQVYQADLLRRLGTLVSTDTVTELRKETDLSQCLMKYTVQAQGTMGYLVALKRHLWLNLAQLPDREMALLLEEGFAPLTTKGLFSART